MSWRACYSAPTPPEAHLVKGFLEQRGVPCLLRSEGPSMYPAAGGLRPGDSAQEIVPQAVGLRRR